MPHAVGDLVDGRFELLAEAGAGGMGTVFRARDRTTGELVALKMLHAQQGADHAARFLREAALLRELAHPAIVRHVAHGGGGDAPLWLAMEWLEGEDLSARLARGPLSIDDALAVIVGVTAGVAAAHERGVVHRDLKPSNLFLDGGRIDRVRVLDFGLARALGSGGDGSRAGVTATGVILGTVGYLSPEQARGASNVDARTDVFALGCIAFECLAGKPAFAGEHAIATLAKLLVEDPPRLKSVRADVPSALESLVARLLAKDPAARPSDAGAVLAALGALPRRSDASSPSIVPRPAASGARLTGGEQRVMAVLLVGQAEQEHGASERTAPSEGAAPTAISLRSPDARRAIASMVLRHGGSADVAADGTVVVTLRGEGAATDLATRAARCALELANLCPDSPFALALGRGVSESGIAAGEVIERAAALFQRARRQRDRGIHVEESLATLLDARFVVTRDDEGAPTLHAERDSYASTRLLLGRVTPFVGRTRELATLEQAWSEAVSEGVAASFLVLGEAGAGKSRLREELVTRALRRAPDAAIGIGRGEALRAGSPFGLVSAILRRAAQIGPAAEASEAQTLLSAFVGANPPPTPAGRAGGDDADDVPRVACFLAEMIGCPFPDGASAALRAARQSSTLMRDQIVRAFVDLVGGVLAQRPLLIVIEDLHWSDAPSTEVIDAVLRRHAGERLMVLALGRPDVEETFRGLWAQRGAQTLRLGPLPARAAIQLCREALPAELADGAAIARIVERSGGSPFVLEELLRARASAPGDATALPDGVLGLVQARLEDLDPVLRRTLRAASIFGRAAGTAGVRHLLGADVSDAALGDALHALARREILESADETWCAFVFRHDLVRDAAYAMLTPNDRATGHALAGAWLEETGETDAALLANHYELGDDPENAARCHVRAAEQAFASHDLGRASTYATRALAHGVKGELRGRALLTLAKTHRWRGMLKDASGPAREALGLLAPGTTAWFGAALVGVVAADLLGHGDALRELVDRATATAPIEPGSASVRIGVLATAAMAFVHRGELDEASALRERTEDDAAPLVATDPYVEAYLHRIATGTSALRGDVGVQIFHWRRMAECFDAVGERHGAAIARANLGFALLVAGENDEGETALRRAIVENEELDARDSVAAARHNLGLALLRRGAIEEALREETLALESFAERGNLRLAGASRIYLAHILRTAGDLERAEAEARVAIVELENQPLIRPFAVAMLAWVLVARGTTAEALSTARAAFDAFRAGPIDEGEAIIRLAWAEALRASGDEPAALAAITDARAALEARAARMPDEAMRASFLTAIPEHARTFELAAAWAAPGPK